MIVMIKTATESREMVRYLAAANVSDSPVLLLEDGVYQASRLIKQCPGLCLRQADAEQRGILVTGMNVVTDKEIVALIEQHGKQVVLR